MKAKLVKHESGYLLYDEDNITIGAEPNVLSSDVFSKLSLKNCQAIERGYDLDELAREFCHPGNGVRDNFQPVFKGIFIQGFQKCLELMGDKKFSEEDMKKAMNKIVTAAYSNKGDDIFDLFIEIHRKKYMDEYIQSLQQTEWDVTFNPEELDADGCLILKRI